MKNITHTKTDSFTFPVEHRSISTLNTSNLQAAVNELQLPCDVTMALAHCGYLRADIDSDQPIFATDDIIELAARIEHFKDPSDVDLDLLALETKETEDPENHPGTPPNISTTSPFAFNCNNRPTL